jgi:hypothetical protein
MFHDRPVDLWRVDSKVGLLLTKWCCHCCCFLLLAVATIRTSPRVAAAATTALCCRHTVPILHQALHFIQIINSGRFQLFDYGSPAENMGECCCMGP